MSDTARKMFPVETVLALAVAKKGADVKDIAGYITGRSIVCDACAAAVAPFAAAWLAKLSPKFLDMNYKDGDNWGDFVNQGARLLGDTISLPPMDDCLKNAVATVLDMMDDMHGTMVSQRAEIAVARAVDERLARDRFAAAVRFRQHVREPSVLPHRTRQRLPPIHQALR